ncbi:MAG: c-type cytochrome domain-containing protein [Hyphomicrobium sp.]
MNRTMRSVPHVTTWALIGALAVIAGLAGMARAVEEVSFKLDVQPILQTRCTQCHAPGGAGYQQSGLDLTSYQGLMKGTKHGPIVVPGDPFTSNLNVIIEGRAAREIQMPHHQRPLLRLQQQILADWVKQGAQNN